MLARASKISLSRSLQIDVASNASVRDGSNTVLAEGPVDVLENNFGAIRCIQAVVPQMRSRRNGCIINVSSVAGRFSSPPLASYCAPKWALEALSEALAGEMKTFNVRVALIEPGIIDTAMAQRIGNSATESHYRQGARYASIFANSLRQPVPPSLVAGKILEVAAGGTWQLRHLVGPDTSPLIELRKQMTDEEWVDWNAADDATFFARLSG